MNDNKRLYSHYVAHIEKLDETEIDAEWDENCSNSLMDRNYSNQLNVFMYIEDGKSVFIPWHQIKVATLSEKICENTP